MRISVKNCSLLLLVFNFVISCATPFRKVELSDGADKVYVINGIEKEKCSPCLFDEKGSKEGYNAIMKDDQKRILSTFEASIHELQNIAVKKKCNAILIKDVSRSFRPFMGDKVVVTADLFKCEFKSLVIFYGIKHKKLHL